MDKSKIIIYKESINSLNDLLRIHLDEINFESFIGRSINQDKVDKFLAQLEESFVKTVANGQALAHGSEY